MNEVLAIWVEGMLKSSSNIRKKKKIRNTRKQVDKLILQHKPTATQTEFEDLLEFVWRWGFYYFWKLQRI